MRLFFIFCFCLVANMAYAQTNVVQNGDFSQGLKGWTIFDKDEAGGTLYEHKEGVTGTRGNVSVVDVQGQPFKKALRATVALKQGDNPFVFGLKAHVPVPLREGQIRDIKVWMRSPESATTSVMLEEAVDPHNRTFQRDLTLTPQWKQYDISGPIARNFSVGQADVTFWLGYKSGTIEIADVRLSALAYAQANIAQNGDFSQGLAGWHIFDQEESRGTVSVFNVEGKKALRAKAIIKPGDVPYVFGVQNDISVPLQKGQTLGIKVRMRSPESVPMSVRLEETVGKNITSFYQELTLTPQWKDYDISGPVLKDYGVGDTRVSFWLGHKSGTIEMTDMRVSVFLSPKLEVQFGHNGGVNCVAYSRDGQTIASGGKDGTVKLWNASTEQLLKTIRLRREHEVLDVAFSPDGKTIATGCNDRWVELWDVQTGENKWGAASISWSQQRAVAFSPDGKTVAGEGGSEDQTTKTIDLRDAQTGEIRRTLPGGGEVVSLAFSPDGSLLVSGSMDGKVRLWDIAAGEPKYAPLDCGGATPSVAFSPDGKTFAGTDSANKLVRLWDVQTGALQRTLDFGAPLNSVAFSPDRKTVVSTGSGVKSWDVTTGQLLRTWASDKEGILKVAFSPYGDTVVGGSSEATINLWDVESGREQKTLGFDATVRAVAVSLDGKTLASSYGDHVVRLWDLTTGELKKVIPVPGVESLVFLTDSRDGKRLVTASSNHGTGTVQIWDWASGKSIQLGPVGPSVHAVALSPDGTTLVSGGDEGVVKVWDILSKNKDSLKSFNVGKSISGLAFSPDGSKVACTMSDSSAVVLGANGDPVLELAGQGAPACSVAFSPDGKRLATAYTNGIYAMWNAATGAQLWRRSDSNKGISLKFLDKEGDLVCGTDGKIITVDAQTGDWIRTLDTNGGSVQALSITPDQRTIITGGRDSIKLWRSTRLLATLVALPPQVLATDDRKALTVDARALTADAKALTADAKALTADAKVVTPAGKVPAMDAKPLTAEVRSVKTSGDYLVVTPEGYYSGTAIVDRYIQFKLFDNLFPAECFQARYSRPDLVKAALSGGAVVPINDFKGAYPPIATFTEGDGGPVTGNTATVTLVSSDDSDVQNVVFRVNGAIKGVATPTQSRPITDADEKVLTAAVRGLTADSRGLTADSKALTADARSLNGDSKGVPTAYTMVRTFTATLPIPVGAETMNIEAIAYDDDGLQSPRVQLTLKTTNTGKATKGRLLGLCVGISHYKNMGANLRDLTYADADASALADSLNKQTELYDRTQVQMLTNNAATATAVSGKLDELIKTTTPADTVVISLSGHGWKDGNEKFYFATTEVDPGDVAHSALSWDAVIRQLKDLSEKSKRVIVLLDACHSGSAATNEELRRAAFKAEAGVLIFTSSARSEVSLEDRSWAHGAFTLALLEALEGKASSGRSASILNLLNYVSDRVVQLTEQRQHPQVPSIQGFDTTAPIIAKP